MKILPILFNTEMVRALLEGRKSVTRRVIKPQPPIDYRYSQADDCEKRWFWTDRDGDDDMMGWWPSYDNGLIPPYCPGDILYVRETWAQGVIDSTDFEGRCNESFFEPYTPPTAFGKYFDECIRYFYRADFSREEEREVHMVWHPSIHMPKEAARIFLRVTDVRVERLQDITEEQAKDEGALPLLLSADPENTPKKHRHWHDMGGALFNFAQLWDSTIKPDDLDKYGWDANPWVWVISFERVDKPEGWPGSGLE